MSASPRAAAGTQQTFNRLEAEIAALREKHAAIREASAALLPAILERGGRVPLTGS